MSDEREEDVARPEVHAGEGEELVDGDPRAPVDANVAIPPDPTIAAKVLSDDPCEADAEDA